MKNCGWVIIFYLLGACAADHASVKSQGRQLRQEPIGQGDIPIFIKDLTQEAKTDIAALKVRVSQLQALDLGSTLIANQALRFEACLLILTLVGIKPASIVDLQAFSRAGVDLVTRLDAAKHELAGVDYRIIGDQVLIVNNQPFLTFSPKRYLDSVQVAKYFSDQQAFIDRVQAVFFDRGSFGLAGEQMLSYYLGFGPSFHTFYIRTGLTLSSDDMIFSENHYKMVGQAYGFYCNANTYASFIKRNAAAYGSNGNNNFTRSEDGTDIVERFDSWNQFVFSVEDLQTDYLFHRSLLVNALRRFLED